MSKDLFIARWSVGGVLIIYIVQRFFENELLIALLNLGLLLPVTIIAVMSAWDLRYEPTRNAVFMKGMAVILCLGVAFFLFRIVEELQRT